MAKTTNYSTIKNLMTVVTFNQPVIVDGLNKIQPIIVESRVESVTDEGAILKLREQTLIGTAVDTEKTLKQLYNLVNSTQTGGIIANALKTVVQDAINIDITV